MAQAPSPLWRLKCPWCEWHLWVSARGQRGGDPGSGVAAAQLGAQHAGEVHGRSWAEFVAAS